MGFDSERLFQKLSEVVPSWQIHTNENMSAHTTFRVGGAADLFVEIDNADQLGSVLCILQAEGVSRQNGNCCLIGNGSNILVSDSGIRGVVLHLSKEFAQIAAEGTTLRCGAGASLAQIAKTACQNALAGFAFASGIPGSLGGAIVMNAGAYGGEMKQVIRSVRMMAPDGTIVEKDTEQMHFSYRHSILKEQDFIVVDAVLALQPGIQEEIKAQMEDLALRRRTKQPLDYPSAGSTFKRPEGYFAAKLIEEAGLCGFSVGGAQVSEKHCGFVVNKNHATALEIYTLIQEVQKRVYAACGVRLDPEVICLGEF